VEERSGATMEQRLDGRPFLCQMTLNCVVDAGSQFFLTYAAHTHLDGSYSIFGHVINGLDVLERLERIPADANDRPTEEILLKSVTIHANPIAE
jgi:cyclophilin family peptidyl-prolyl cis-trans isomerase